MSPFQSTAPTDLPDAGDDEPQADSPSADLAQAQAAGTPSNVASDAPLAPEGGEEPDMRDPTPEPAPEVQSNPAGGEAVSPAPVKEHSFPAHCSWLASYFPKTDD